MLRESREFTILVETLRRHFEHSASRDDATRAVRDACMAMHASGVEPQTMLVSLKMAVQSAALDAHTIVDRDVLRSLTADLTPLMIEVCFDGRRPGRH